MSIILTTTWYPRGELPRFIRLLPTLLEKYQKIVVSYIPDDDPAVKQEFVSGHLASNPGLTFYECQDGSVARYMAMKLALEAHPDYIQYVDMDRLLRWVETRPDEWLQALEQIEKFDCIIFGRTQTAMLTHPQALITTEIASNRVVSSFLGREMDVSAGSKSFSRAAAQYLIDHLGSTSSIAADATWTIGLKQAGFSLEYIQVDGLDYESADQFQSQAANAGQQRQAAAEYDADPAHWSKRVDIANQIIASALDLGRKKHSGEKFSSQSQEKEFDVEAVFDVDDYLYFYSESLTDERTDVEVHALVRLLELDRPLQILDLACGYGRHANRLAALGHRMTGVDLTPGFLEIARREARKSNLDVDYQLGDMRSIAFEEQFDRVMLVFTSFGYFTDAENLKVLINARSALKPGGMIIFDTLDRDALLKGMRPYFVVEKEGNLMIDRFSFDGLQGRYHNKRIVIRDGIRKDKPYFVRLYNPSEIKTILTQAGLELHQMYDGWEEKAYSSGAYRMVVIARKPD